MFSSLIFTRRNTCNILGLHWESLVLPSLCRLASRVEEGQLVLVGDFLIPKGVISICWYMSSLEFLLLWLKVNIWIDLSTLIKKYQVLLHLMLFWSFHLRILLPCRPCNFVLLQNCDFESSSNWYWWWSLQLAYYKREHGHKFDCIFFRINNDNLGEMKGIETFPSNLDY